MWMNTHKRSWVNTQNQIYLKIICDSSKICMFLSYIQLTLRNYLRNTFADNVWKLFHRKWWECNTFQVLWLRSLKYKWCYLQLASVCKGNISLSREISQEILITLKIGHMPNTTQTEQYHVDNFFSRCFLWALVVLLVFPCVLWFPVLCFCWIMCFFLFPFLFFFFFGCSSSILPFFPPLPHPFLSVFISLPVCFLKREKKKGCGLGYVGTIWEQLGEGNTVCEKISL